MKNFKFFQNFPTDSRMTQFIDDNQILYFTAENVLNFKIKPKKYIFEKKKKAYLARL